MENPYTRLIEIFKNAGQTDVDPFRMGVVVSADPLMVSVSGVVCDDEIAGVAQGYAPEIGDNVLLANLNNTDNDYILICKVV